MTSQYRIQTQLSNMLIWCKNDGGKKQVEIGTNFSVIDIIYHILPALYCILQITRLMQYQ